GGVADFGPAAAQRTHPPAANRGTAVGQSGADPSPSRWNVERGRNRRPLNPRAGPESPRRCADVSVAREEHSIQRLGTARWGCRHHRRWTDGIHKSRRRVEDTMNRREQIREKALTDLQKHEVLMRDGHFDFGNGYHGRVYL